MFAIRFMLYPKCVLNLPIAMHEAILNLCSSPLSFLCIYTEPFVVGFAETMYTVSEGNGQVEVCVNLTSPDGDIGDEVVLVEVFSNTNPESFLTGSTAASKLNELFSRKPMQCLCEECHIRE